MSGGLRRTMETMFWAGEEGFQPLQERARRLLEAPTRQILGIAGSPGSGKSTLAAALLIELERTDPGTVVLVGMDAFHLGHRVLERHGLVAVKGVPETFDPLGYLALLARIKNSAQTVYAPEFHREIEDSIAHNIEVPAEIRLVITEGNYLLLAQPPWNRIRALLDDAWFIHLADHERRRRMVTRHEFYGRDRETAIRRTLGSDEANARLINSAQTAPDLWIENRG
jgi:pantothenate kinase